MPDLSVNGSIDLVKLMEALIDCDGDFHGYEGEFLAYKFREVFYQCAVEAFTTRAADDGKISRTAMEQIIFETYGIRD